MDIFAKLIPEFADKMQLTLNGCKLRGVIMTPYFGERTPKEQGRLWRQGKTVDFINEEIAKLKQQGCPYLADCVEHAAPSFGSIVTRALPGLSWHQWGEAVDAYWRVDDRAEWSSTKMINGLNGYVVYAEEGIKNGLTAGGHFKSLKDWPHLQLSPAPEPLGRYTMQQIDTLMKHRYGG